MHNPTQYQTLPPQALLAMVFQNYLDKMNTDLDQVQIDTNRMLSNQIELERLVEELVINNNNDSGVQSSKEVSE